MGSAERYPVSFASQPGRDDGSLPPANIEIPDDARDLARDVIAYHRELRAKRRRERMARLLRPFARTGFFRHGSIFPLIATCVALSLIVGTMLSVLTVRPASRPSTRATPPAATGLPQDTVKLGGGLVPVSRLAGSVLVLIPPTCGCGAVLSGIAKQAASARVAVYFVYAAGNAQGAARVANLTAAYGDGVAQTVYDINELLFFDYAPTSPVALVVARDGTVGVHRTFPPGFDLSPALRSLEGTH
ncbi:MAG: hypothetical protein JWM19_5144 [Actinomycetia bacterium]|nr:hypothetical protein [Actinomycetes bacterium]